MKALRAGQVRLPTDPESGVAVSEQKPDADDARWMRRAFELARTGLGRTSPNPAVGAVVVAGSEAVGEGIHEYFGGPHAEVNALAAAGERARGATLYVTFEPCRHQGKTPPCTDAILAAGVTRVVYAAADPNPEACGGGEVLRERGVMVSPGVMAQEGEEFYAYFCKHVRRGRSFVIAKWAMTADGRLATRKGDSHWVSSEASRERARLLRAECDVVAVGIGTVLRDDPRLSSRTGDGREPLRVVVDSGLRTPPTSELFNVAGGSVLIACSESAAEDREEALKKRGAAVLRLPSPGGRVSIEALLDALHERGKLRVLVEGGPTLLGALFDVGLVDEARVFVAPKIVGDKQSPGAVSGRGVARMSGALEIARARWEVVGPDILRSGRVGDWDWMK